MEDKKVIENIKISAHITPEVYEALRRLAYDRDITITDVINRAIMTEKFFADEQGKGEKILLENKYGERQRVLFNGNW